MLVRKRQIAAKIEAAEGVAETLAAADARLYVIEPKFNPDVQVFERTPARASLSKLQGVRGSKIGVMTFGLELRGSGTAATAPEWSKLLRACGFVEETGASIVKIPVTGLAGGPFQHGEVVTGGTSGDTAIVMRQLSADGDIWLRGADGPFQAAEIITGTDSTATATTGTPVGSAGVSWKPTSGDANVPTLTMAGYFDGLHHKIAGCRGTVTFAHALDEPVIMNFEFRGFIVQTTDVALLTGIAHETTVPPVFINAALDLPGEYDACFNQLDVSINNTVVPRRCANSVDGVTSYKITERNVEVTMNPEQVLVATHDFFNILYAGTIGYMEWQVGTTTGNAFFMAVPVVQYTGISDDDEDGRAINGLTLSAIEDEIDAEDELELIQY